jgi:hypothetical protein
LIAGMTADLSAMLAPLEIAESEASRFFAARVAAATKSAPAGDGDELDQVDIDRLTSASRRGEETLHLLVMDLHKALNRLATDTALEALDGARVHRLDEGDRARVRAFMRGLNRTALLAFGHPGLGTTAVRANERLTIQNDIGATDAHVLVIHVEDRAATVTDTDVHRQRAKFFISLFEGRNVAWSPLADQAGTGFDENIFYLLTGRCAAANDQALDDFLEFLGSRIVFLIDWNKARKALQSLVGKKAAVDLLIWAARHDFGHRAFLELGGAELIFEAVQGAAAGRIPYGSRLDEALDAEPVAEFLQRVLRDTSQGLAAGRTARLIRDEIRTDLSRQFETAESSVLTMPVRHLGLARALAGAISAVLCAPASATAAERRGLAYRAKLIEEKADHLTIAAREIAARIRDAGMLQPMIDEIENNTDALEDCAFLLGLPQKRKPRRSPSRRWLASPRS